MKTPAIFEVAARRKQSREEIEATVSLALHRRFYTPENIAEAAAKIGPDPALGTFYVTQKPGEKIADTHERAYTEGAAKYPVAELTVTRMKPGFEIEAA